MTLIRQNWFPLCVVVLLAVIGVNLYALNGRWATNKDDASKTEQRHAHVAPKNDAHAKTEHGPVAKEPEKQTDKKEPSDHGVMDHKGMLGKGMMDHKGMMNKMHGNMADMMDIRFLLVNHKKIKRTVKRLPNGVESVTTSSDEAVAGKIQVHVRAMYERLQKKQTVRPMDPLFAAIFENAEKIDIGITKLPDGLRVTETSNDAYAVKLIHAHAEVVDRFVQEGMSAMMMITPAPKRE
jgi:hypothetical protein